MNTTTKPAPKAIPMTPCKSSQVESYGFDAESRTLALKFRSGGEYHYFEVSHETFEQLKTCESVGKFLGSEIRGKFRFVRLDSGGLGQVIERERTA